MWHSRLGRVALICRGTSETSGPRGLGAHAGPGGVCSCKGFLAHKERRMRRIVHCAGWAFKYVAVPACHPLPRCPTTCALHHLCSPHGRKLGRGRPGQRVRTGGTLSLGSCSSSPLPLPHHLRSPVCISCAASLTCS